MAITRRACAHGLVASGLLVSGCGLLEEEPPGTPDCEIAPPGNRDLVGVALQRQADGTSYALLQARATARRGSRNAVGGGRPTGLRIGETPLRTGLNPSAAFDGIRAVSVSQADAPSPRPTAATYGFQFSELDDFRGLAILGRPVGPGQVPTAGQLRFSGSAELTLSDLGATSGTQKRASGTATVVLGVGSGTGVLSIEGLQGPEGTDGIARIVWQGLRLCGRRIVSTGTGKARVLGANGAALDILGPPPSAVFDSTLYRAPAGGPPDNLGGALVIQGDAGSLAAVFLAGNSPSLASDCCNNRQSGSA